MNGIYLKDLCHISRGLRLGALVTQQFSHLLQLPKLHRSTCVAYDSSLLVQPECNFIPTILNEARAAHAFEIKV